MLRWLRGWVLLLRARGFSPLPPAGRRQAREIISKKLSGKCGRQNASGRARDKATLQFSDRPPPQVDFDGRAAKERARAVAPSPANNVLWLPKSIYSESANDCKALLFV